MTSEYDLFISYARADNAGGWITRFIEELLAEHTAFTHHDPAGNLELFFDKDSIGSFDDWQHRIHDCLARSRLFLAFLSPNYFASEWCRREWRAWIDTEISKHILSAGAAPIYFVEIPGFVGKVAGLAQQATLSEQEVAAEVADLCALPLPHESFIAAVGPVVANSATAARSPRISSNPSRTKGSPPCAERISAGCWPAWPPTSTSACGMKNAPPTASPPSRPTTNASPVASTNSSTSASDSRTTAPASSPASTASAASARPNSLSPTPTPLPAYILAVVSSSAAMANLPFATPSSARATSPASSARTSATRNGNFPTPISAPPCAACASGSPPPATSCWCSTMSPMPPSSAVGRPIRSPRLAPASTCWPPPACRRPAAPANWVSLGQLPEPDALDMMEKFRPFASAAEREAARVIVRRLGGFTLAVELAAAHLKEHPDLTCKKLAGIIGLEDLEDPAVLESAAELRYDHDRRLSAVLGPTLAALSPAERRALEYAALLPPDHVPLPWLESLVVADFPEIGRPGRLTHPWSDLWRHLEKLALFTRPETETTEPRLMRVHRLVQELVWSPALRGLGVPPSGGSPDETPPLARVPEESCPTEPPEGGTPNGNARAARQQSVDALVRARDAALEKETHWENARWELEPLEALAWLWAEPVPPAPGSPAASAAGPHPPTHEEAAWLLNQAGLRRHHLAEWSLAEPLMRRALAIVEASFGSEHPEVALKLNNLARLLQDTNRLAEAEPLMRRSVEICVKSWGEKHPSTANGQVNLGRLLLDLGRRQEAEPLVQQALDIREQSQTPNDPRAGKAHLGLGEIEKDRGNLMLAKQHREEAVRLLSLASGSNPRELELARQKLQSLA